MGFTTTNCRGGEINSFINSPETEIAAIVTTRFERAENVFAIHSCDGPRNKGKNNAAAAQAIDEAGDGGGAMGPDPPEKRY